ncbi:hypothetical protein FlaCF_3603 [Flavobacterium tructae]
MIIFFKNIRNFLFLLLLTLVFLNCNSHSRSGRLYLYNKDKTQVITILTDYSKNERIIALGKLDKVPQSDYVTLNISEVTELADEIGICWFIENGGWQLVNDKSKIVTVHLDTTKYKIKTNWHLDEKAIPTPEYYRKTNCYTVGLLGNPRLHPNNNGDVESFD